MSDTAISLKVQASINAPIEKVWQLWTSTVDITNWNSPSPDWHTPSAQQDLKVGGSFTYRMEAKDGSFGFDFGGVFDVVMPNKQLAYTMGDGRKASTLFKKKGNQALVSTTFDAENENPPEFQQQGWQAILNNFKNYAEKTVFNQNHLKK